MTLRAAGGSNGQGDAELRAAAAANWTGSYGATGGAIIAGTLRSRGVSRTLVMEDDERGETVIYPVDPSWAWSAAWAASVERNVRDGWLGVGCRLRSGRVLNRVVRGAPGERRGEGRRRHRPRRGW